MLENNTPTTESPDPLQEPFLPQPPHRSRRGKIARLPKALRQQLNQRLQDGEPAKTLAEWLNGLPEVQTILKAQFHDKPIREQNISEWRQGGYLEWELAEERRLTMGDLVEEMQDLQETTKEGLTHRMAAYMMAQIALAIQWLHTLPMGVEKIRGLRALTTSLVALRRGDIQMEQLLFQRDKHGLKTKTKEEKEAEFWKWAEVNINRDEFCRRRCFTVEQREAAIRKILGVEKIPNIIHGKCRWCGAKHEEKPAEAVPAADGKDENNGTEGKDGSAPAAPAALVEPAQSDSIRVNPTCSTSPTSLTNETCEACCGGCPAPARPAPETFMERMSRSTLIKP